MSSLFYTISSGFLVGVLIRSFVYFDFSYILLFGLISFGLILLCVMFRQKSHLLLVAIFLLALSLGVWRFQIADRSGNPDVDNFVEENVIIHGMIVDEPDERETNLKLTVRIKEIGLDTDTTNVGHANKKISLENEKSFTLINDKINVLVTTELYGEYRYGDIISFSGSLLKPENFETDTGRIFDYVNYLDNDDIFYVMRYPKEIEIIESGQGNMVYSFLYKIKQKFIKNISLYIKEPQASLLGGLTVGAKNSLPADLKEDLVKTGTIHIVALSGFNVSLVADYILIILGAILGMSASLIISIIAIILFVLMTGAQATAVRAGIMAILVLFSKLRGRQSDITRALVLTAVLMVAVNPKVLVFDVSFQLSFLATIAIIYLAPIVERKFKKLPNFLQFRQILSATLATYIFVLPFLLYKIGTLSLVALPANLLILILIPITTIFGFLTGILGFIWPILSLPFAYVSQLLLSYELKVVQLGGNLPFAAKIIPEFSVWIILLIYLFFALYIYRNFKSDLPR